MEVTKKKGTKIYEEINNITDIDTGEVKVIENRIVRKVNQDEFVQIYLDDLSGLLSISTGNESKLLSILWKKSEWNTENSSMGNKVVIVKPFKDEWAKELGIGLQAINNIISGLVKKNLLIKKDRSVYYLNPKYFFKGFSKDRVKAIKTVLSYTFSENPNQQELFDEQD